VQIALSEGYVDALINEVIAPFCAQYPMVDIRMETLPVDDVLNEVAESRAHIGLAYNPPLHPRIEYRASAAQPIVLLTRHDHPLALRGTAVSVHDLTYPLALMPESYGIGHAAKMLEFAENVRIRPTLVTNSLAALKQFVAYDNFRHPDRAIRGLSRWPPARSPRCRSTIRCFAARRRGCWSRPAARCRPRRWKCWPSSGSGWRCLPRPPESRSRRRW
jgi:hypothetical protein